MRRPAPAARTLSRENHDRRTQAFAAPLPELARWQPTAVGRMQIEAAYFSAGAILPHVLDGLLAEV